MRASWDGRSRASDPSPYDAWGRQRQQPRPPSSYAYAYAAPSTATSDRPSSPPSNAYAYESDGTSSMARHPYRYSVQTARTPTPSGDRVFSMLPPMTTQEDLLQDWNSNSPRTRSEAAIADPYSARSSAPLPPRWNDSPLKRAMRKFAKRLRRTAAKLVGGSGGGGGGGDDVGRSGSRPRNSISDSTTPNNQSRLGPENPRRSQSSRRPPPPRTRARTTSYDAPRQHRNRPYS